MTVKTEETESQEALPNTKFEGKLQLALEGLNPSIQRSLLGISKRNSIYIIDFVINELKKENNASLNYVRMNVYAIVDLVNHCKKSDLRKFTREDVILQKVVLPLSSVPTLFNHIQRQVTDYSCCKMLISFPNGSRTKKLRTPQGSLSGPYSIGMPIFKAAITIVIDVGTPIIKNFDKLVELN